MFYFYTPLKTSENQRFSDFFRRYRNGALVFKLRLGLSNKMHMLTACSDFNCSNWYNFPHQKHNQSCCQYDLNLTLGMSFFFPTNFCISYSLTYIRFDTSRKMLFNLASWLSFTKILVCLVEELWIMTQDSISTVMICF